MKNLTKEWLRLLEILKSDEELKIWDYVRIYKDKSVWQFLKKVSKEQYIIDYYFSWLKYYNISAFERKDFKILWQANYEHLLRYLKWDYSINWDWDFILECCEWMNYTWIEFSLKKPLLEQDEEVLRELNIYLDNLK